MLSLSWTSVSVGDAVLDVLGHDVVRSLLVGADPCTSLIGRRHLLHELLPAHLRVKASLSGSPVPLDVATLGAIPIVMVELLEVGDVNTQLS